MPKSLATSTNFRCAVRKANEKIRCLKTKLKDSLVYNSNVRTLNQQLFKISMMINLNYG